MVRGSAKKTDEVGINADPPIVRIHRMLEKFGARTLLFDTKKPLRCDSTLPIRRENTDKILDGLVVVECKTTAKYNEIFQAEVLTYLRLMNLKLGIVVNFGGRLVNDGFHRVVNGLSGRKKTQRR